MKKKNEEVTELFPVCPVCGGQGNALGILGKFRWFRCRDCGAQFNEKVEEADRQAFEERARKFSMFFENNPEG